MVTGTFAPIDEISPTSSAYRQAAAGCFRLVQERPYEIACRLPPRDPFDDRPRIKSASLQAHVLFPEHFELAHEVCGRRGAFRSLPCRFFREHDFVASHFDRYPGTRAGMQSIQDSLRDRHLPPGGNRNRFHYVIFPRIRRSEVLLPIVAEYDLTRRLDPCPCRRSRLHVCKTQDKRRGLKERT